ncbi:hypothetical protein [Pseudoalteromonas sp.]|uniref:hypothetical protein n=1 Tax=Pseudoalteromonas sp. TaxID=53249 RepID=UPI00260755E5|nr:hypothetical protein [Pseudoalteromonas sp.]MCP4585368.1 hypothetical protein [Pseudoalteromonas sp.]
MNFIKLTLPERVLYDEKPIWINMDQVVEFAFSNVTAHTRLVYNFLTEDGDLAYTDVIETPEAIAKSLLYVGGLK